MVTETATERITTQERGPADETLPAPITLNRAESFVQSKVFVARAMPGSARAMPGSARAMPGSGRAKSEQSRWARFRALVASVAFAVNGSGSAVLDTDRVGARHTNSYLGARLPRL